jgi:hypothetical protein
MIEFKSADKVKLLTQIVAGHITYDVGHQCLVISVLTGSVNDDPNTTRYLIDGDILNQDGDYESPFMVTATQIEKIVEETMFDN